MFGVRRLRAVVVSVWNAQMSLSAIKAPERCFSRLQGLARNGVGRCYGPLQFNTIRSETSARDWVVINHFGTGFLDALLYHTEVFFIGESIGPVNNGVLLRLAPSMSLPLFRIKTILKCYELDIDAVREFDELIDCTAICVGTSIWCLCK
jgi:hypothetical protein